MLTRDDSWAAALISEGLERRGFGPSPHEARITNVVGARDQVEVHVRELSLSPGDRLLLCSDGLHEPMTEDRIAPVLGGEADVTRRPPTRLVREALERGSRDNVTALVVDVGALK